jgi:hypothetical protein
MPPNRCPVIIEKIIIAPRHRKVTGSVTSKKMRLLFDLKCSRIKEL